MSDMSIKNDGPVMDLSVLEPAELSRARDMAKQINLTDTQSVIQYGVGAQTKIAGFADTILAEIRNKDAGYVGDALGGLLGKIKEVDVGSLGTGGSFLEKVPILGGFVSSVKKFITRYEKISVQIEKIIMELETARMNLLRDITMLDTYYEKNREYLRELDIIIAAGGMKIEEVRAAVLPELKAKAEASNDPMDAQRFQDMNQLVNRFEKKLHDMKLSRMIAIQAGPQVRLVQGNNQMLVEKIQSSILTTIPLWKNQIVIAISLMRQKKALELQKEVTDRTNELLKKNAEMLKEGSLGVARESERGIVEIETLKQVNNDLISTIEETLKIQREGKDKRRLAEEELVKMENELKTRLKTIQAA
jgi:uncharacterized protein YaaN involved in tellurite resistance